MIDILKLMIFNTFRLNNHVYHQTILFSYLSVLQVCYDTLSRYSNSDLQGVLNCFCPYQAQMLTICTKMLKVYLLKYMNTSRSYPASPGLTPSPRRSPPREKYFADFLLILPDFFPCVTCRMANSVCLCAYNSISSKDTFF